MKETEEKLKLELGKRNNELGITFFYLLTPDSLFIILI